MSRLTAPTATILVRIMVGSVFVSEGLQKFLFPAALGEGRFAAIGLPAPGLLAPTVGIIEVVCGGLVLFGLLTQVASLPLIGVMLGALITTKLPILLGHDVGPFVVRARDRYGFCAAAHEARTDLSMLLGALFLLIVGPGAWSLDARRGGLGR
jgi:putative oxidoreductase